MESTQREKSTKKTHTSNLTKLAFLSVFLAAVVGTVVISLEQQNREAKRQVERQQIQSGSKVSLDSRTKEVFSQVSNRLFNDAFFGVNELEKGFSVIVAGYVEDEVQTDEGRKIQIQPFIVEESKPISILLSEDDHTVVTWKNGESVSQSFSQAKKALKKGTPIAFTVYFEDETQYMLAVRGLENFNDYLTLEFVKEPKFSVTFPSSSISQLEIL